MGSTGRWKLYVMSVGSKVLYPGMEVFFYLHRKKDNWVPSPNFSHKFIFFLKYSFPIKWHFAAYAYVTVKNNHDNQLIMYDGLWNEINLYFWYYNSSRQPTLLTNHRWVIIRGRYVTISLPFHIHSRLFFTWNIRSLWNDISLPMPHNRGSENKTNEFKVTRTSGDNTSESEYEKESEIVTYGTLNITHQLVV